MTPKEQLELVQRWRERGVDDAHTDFRELLKRHPETGNGHERDDLLLVLLYVGTRVGDVLGDMGQ